MFRYLLSSPSSFCDWWEERNRLFGSIRHKNKCQIRREVKHEVREWGAPAERGKKEQQPNHLGVMVCEANISSVSVEPWRRGGLVVGRAYLLSVWCWGVEEDRSGSPVMAQLYIVAIPHLLQLLQLLLPITPPTPNSPRGQSEPLAPQLKWSG